MVVKKDEAIYVSLLETLACQLNNNAIFEEVRMPTIS